MSTNLANYGAPHCRRLFMAGHCRYTTDSSTKTSGLRRRAADASAGGSRAGIFHDFPQGKPLHRCVKPWKTMVSQGKRLHRRG